MPPNDGPTCGRGSTSETSSSAKTFRSSSCSTSTILFFRLITRLEAGLLESETADMLLKSKLKPEKFGESRVQADSGDVDDVDAVDGDDDWDGPNAVLRRRNDARGWSG